MGLSPTLAALLRYTEHATNVAKLLPLAERHIGFPQKTNNLLCRIMLSSAHSDLLSILQNLPNSLCITRLKLLGRSIFSTKSACSLNQFTANSTQIVGTGTIHASDDLSSYVPQCCRTCHIDGVRGRSGYLLERREDINKGYDQFI